MIRKTKPPIKTYNLQQQCDANIYCIFPSHKAGWKLFDKKLMSFKGDLVGPKSTNIDEEEEE